MTVLNNWIQISVNIATLIGIVIGIGIQLRTQFNVGRVHLELNSMKTAQVAAAKETGELVGEKRGREDEQARQEAKS